MQGSLVQFLTAGHETTSSALSFMVYYLVLYPGIQDKIQQEVDQVYPQQVR